MLYLRHYASGKVLSRQNCWHSKIISCIESKMKQVKPNDSEYTIVAFCKTNKNLSTFNRYLMRRDSKVAIFQTIIFQHNSFHNPANNPWKPLTFLKVDYFYCWFQSRNFIETDLIAINEITGNLNQILWFQNHLFIFTDFITDFGI